MNRDAAIGIGYILIVHLCAPLLLAGIRFLADDHGYHPFQLVFFYSVVPLAVLIPIALIQKWPLKTTKHKPYIMRGGGEFSGFALQFFSLQTISLPMQTALAFTVPLFAIPIALVLFKEKIGKHIPISLAVGFIGVLMITRPGGEAMDVGVFYMLMAALMFAFCVNMIRLVASADEPPQRIMFYMYFYTSIITAPFALYHWTPIMSDHVIYIAMIATASIAQQFFVAKALQKAPITIIMPMQFMMLVFVSIMAYFVFSEVIDVWTASGAAIILAGSMYHIFKSTRHVEIIAEATSGEILVAIPDSSVEKKD